MRYKIVLFFVVQRCSFFFFAALWLCCRYVCIRCCHICCCHIRCCHCCVCMQIAKDAGHVYIYTYIHACGWILVLAVRFVLFLCAYTSLYSICLAVTNNCMQLSYAWVISFRYTLCVAASIVWSAYSYGIVTNIALLPCLCAQ